MNIYELRREAQEALDRYLDCFDADTGEQIVEEKMQEELFSELRKLQNKESEITDWILMQRQNSESRMDALTSEITRLLGQRETEDRKIERMESLFTFLHPELEKPTVFGNWTASYRKSESTVILDKSKIPDKYMRKYEPIQPEPEPDKTAIKDAIKAGHSVDGAEIVKKSKLVIK